MGLVVRVIFRVWVKDGVRVRVWVRVMIMVRVEYGVMARVRAGVTVHHRHEHIDYSQTRYEKGCDKQ